MLVLGSATPPWLDSIPPRRSTRRQAAFGSGGSRGRSRGRVLEAQGSWAFLSPPAADGACRPEQLGRRATRGEDRTV